MAIDRWNSILPSGIYEEEKSRQRGSKIKSKSQPERLALIVSRRLTAGQLPAGRKVYAGL